jgi:two-component system chemotaxis sensor kinase CheA
MATIAERCHTLEEHLLALPQVDAEAATAIAGTWTEFKAKLASVFGPDLTTPGADVRAEDLAELRDAIARGASIAAIKRLVKSWDLERIRPRLDRFAEQAQHLAERLGKGRLIVEVADHGVRMDASRLRPFWSALTHVVRNAVDHGIESPAERVAAGKPADGRLVLETLRDGAAVIVEIRDDGAGIDWDAVRQRARQASLATATQADLVDALLSDGLTTRDVVSETSGRGVGLAAVRAACAAMNATIHVASERGKGSRFRFTFTPHQASVPIARDTTEAVSSRDQPA